MTEQLKLHIFQRHAGFPDISPFGVKLESYLRAAKIPYDSVSYGEHQMKNSPKKKCPYVQRSDINGGAPLGDTKFIMSELVKKGAPDFDAWLSESERAVSAAFRIMLEDNFYWCITWAKWATPEYKKHTAPIFFESAPWILRPIIGRSVRNEMLKALHRQGIGRHTEEEILCIARDQVTALSTLLESKKYMMGDRLCMLDFTAFGMLSYATALPWEHPILELVRKDKRLMDYVARIQRELFLDLVEAEAQKAL
eukprot:CAMPEP_0181309794 /NCGR_PEP_ID=MMETSP1101-20121128/12217_1 /TAXON_ID=46948 /ORGANISM="Rhodomonas abbreviata, Strain Caron Lab Isolate" /LENGTH=252 /DNA_ID=CAMNT_0023416329 /DNA_START=36 /DNA_END=794 /DNA_ORIENTATION=+